MLLICILFTIIMLVIISDIIVAVVVVAVHPFEPKYNTVNIDLNVALCEFPIFVPFACNPVWTAST